jgi:hypothetical protein
MYALVFGACANWFSRIIELENSRTKFLLLFSTWARVLAARHCVVVVRELKVLVEGQVKALCWRKSEERAATRTDRAIALD